MRPDSNSPLAARSACSSRNFYPKGTPRRVSASCSSLERWRAVSCEKLVNYSKQHMRAPFQSFIPPEVRSQKIWLQSPICFSGKHLPMDGLGSSRMRMWHDSSVFFFMDSSFPHEQANRYGSLLIY